LHRSALKSRPVLFDERQARHCEEQSDEAIQIGAAALDCFASASALRFGVTQTMP
jgi:hypothetical protein